MLELGHTWAYDADLKADVCAVLYCRVALEAVADVFGVGVAAGGAG